MSATKGHGKTAKHGGSRRADHAESDAGRSSTIPAAYWQYYGIGRGDAEAYREKMRAKLDALAGTVHLAMVIFQQACYAKLVGAKQSANEKAADVVVGTVISHVYGLLKSAVAAEVGPLGIAMKLGLEGIKQAASKGDGKVQEAELIARIVKGVEEAARDFVRKAKEQVAKIPDRQATDDGRLLQETENTTADLEALDSPGDGSIRQGVRDQFLEAAGAPATGGVEAEALAIEAIRVYQAERIKLFSGTDRVDAAQEALSDPARGIHAAEERIGVDQEIKADRAERSRASLVTPPIK